MKKNGFRRILLLLLALGFLILPMGVPAVGETGSADKQKQLTEALKDFRRSEALDLMDDLSLDPKTEPEFYMLNLSRKIWIVKFYQRTDELVQTAIELLNVAEANQNSHYRLEAMDALAYVDYFNFDNTLALKKWNVVATLAMQNEQQELYRYYRGLALLAEDSKQQDSAIAHYRKAIEIAQKENLVAPDGTRIVSNLYQELSAFYYRSKNYDAAAQEDENARSIIPTEDAEARFAACIRLADDYLLGGHVDQAAKAIQQAEELKEKLSDRLMRTDFARDMKNLEASISYLQGDTRKAAELFYESYLGGKQGGGNLDIYIETQNTASAYQTASIEKELNLLTQLQKEQEAKLESQKYLLFVFILSSLLLAAFLLTKISALKQQKLQKEALFRLSNTDQLTQLKNRKRIMEELEEMLPGSKSVALLDVDCFKLVNDNYGHATGDLVLRRIAETMRGAIRESDELGRYGGEEFLLLLDTDDLGIAIEIAERVRKSVAQLEWEQEGLSVTVSIGLVYSRGKTSDELLAEADSLLYRSKRMGRNQLTAAQV